MVSCISSFQSICFEEDVEIPNCVQLAILPPDASCEGWKSWVTVRLGWLQLYRVSTCFKRPKLVVDFTSKVALGILYPACLGHADWL